MDDDKRVTRKGSPPIKVYCLPDERAAIEAKARSAGMSVACYLREAGQGHRLRAIADFERVQDLARINGDLGRLGGLLKLWLSDDARTAEFERSTILRLLARIETTQDEMAQVMRLIVRPRAVQ